MIVSGYSTPEDYARAVAPLSDAQEHRRMAAIWLRNAKSAIHRAYKPRRWKKKRVEERKFALLCLFYALASREAARLQEHSR